MGLFTTLVTLPLAPVRGAAWVAQQVAEEAERQLYDESRIRRELLQLELDHDAGVIGDEEHAAQSEELLARLSEARAVRQQAAAQSRGRLTETADTEDSYG
jgi:Gas vesicle protein G